jgi:hypothetical protein
MFGGPGLDDPMRERLQEAARPWPILADDDHDLMDRYPGALVWVLDDASSEAPVRGRLRSPDITYLVHSATLCAHDRPGVPLIDVCPATLSVATALEVL